MIVVKITDGLGNQMFQYAYARSLQTKTRQKVYLDTSDMNHLKSNNPQIIERAKICDIREYQLDHFSITLPVITSGRLDKLIAVKDRKSKFSNYCKELRLSHTVYVTEQDCGEKGFKYSKYQNYYVFGSFFDQSYFKNIEDLLRREFRLKNKINIPIDIYQILQNRNTVSLHIRRGDFLRVGRDMSGDYYYDRAVNYIKRKVDNPFLIIFSNDIEWVKREKKFDLDHLYISDNGFSDWEELILMSMCKNNIMANSTYSYWGAWLNSNADKIVVTPRGWRQKIIPKSWVAL